MRAILKAFAQLDLWAGQSKKQTRLDTPPWTADWTGNEYGIEKVLRTIQEKKRARKANLNIKIIKIQHEKVLSFLLFAGLGVGSE